MESMEGYMDLFRKEGHSVSLLKMNGVIMKATRVKAAKFIIQQLQKMGSASKKE